MFYVHTEAMPPGFGWDCFLWEIFKEEKIGEWLIVSVTATGLGATSDHHCLPLPLSILDSPYCCHLLFFISVVQFMQCDSPI